MYFSLSTSAGRPTRFLRCLFLAGILVNAIAIPVQQVNKDVQLRDPGISILSIPETVALIRSPTDEIKNLVARAKAKPKATKPKAKKPVTKPKSKPKKKTPKKKPKKKPATPKKTPTKPKVTPKPTPSPKPKPDPVPSERTMQRQCKVPKNKAFFWSGTPGVGNKYAAQNRLTMDENAFPKNFVARYSGRDGKPRDDKSRDVFTRRFSKVFATKATGIVHVMVPWATGPKADRVFHANEWPVLKKRFASGQITKIIQVNPDDFKETRDYNPKVYGLAKRAEDVDLENLSWDVDLDALSEKWQIVNKERVHEEEKEK
jgi:hypothetical protein